METSSLLAPVTALEFFRGEFLLVGEGPLLSVYSLQSQPNLSASLSVLQHYRIHGIRPRSQAQICAGAVHRQSEHGWAPTSECRCYDLVVFGGKAVRLVRLHVDLESVEHLQLEILGPHLNLKDWALDARWLSGNKQSLLCVAVAHNSALLLDVVAGNILVYSSCQESCLLYSALLLVHESWEDTILVGGTVFNKLVIWKPTGGHENSSSGYKVPVERHLSGHNGVIFSISYLEEKGCLASASDDRSVRVWGVGALGGLGGKCGDLNPTCLTVLYGHLARVFSVHLSPRRLFSAGEDGTCLVWDWADGGKLVQTLKGHRAGGIRALAVSEGEVDDTRWVATGGADGGVRLWKMDWSEEKESGKDPLTDKLSDLKFHSHGLPKVVCLVEENLNASWSHFVVCTDKGVVSQYTEGKWETLWRGTSEFHSYCVMDTVTVSVKDSASTVHLCALGTLSGSLQVFATSQPQSGIRLTGGSGKIQSIIWQKGTDGVYLLASGAEGFVYRWCIAVKVNGDCSLVLGVKSLPPFLLPSCAKRWLTAAVRLHPSSEEVLWVCGDRRGSLLLYQEEETVEQKKSQEDPDRKECDKVHGLTLQPLSCLFGLHGKHGVTSVCEYQGLLYSTGKDGCVRIFRVHQRTSEKYENRRDNPEEDVDVKERLQLEVLRVQRACKGMEWLERILILGSEISPGEEKASADRCKNRNPTKQNVEVLGDGKIKENLREGEVKGREARFVIVGFHAVNFVVWDPLRQERLLVVPCGGGHRSWSLWPSHLGIWPGYGALVFIKQGSVLTSQPPGKAMDWDRKSGRNGGWSLRDGVHGRGIWCVTRLGKIGAYETNTLMNCVASTANNGRGEVEKKGHWEIVVTGGEDTSLAVLGVHPVSGQIKVLSVITDHISGVRAMAAVTHPDGGNENSSRSFSALLMSAGGRAQIHCYRLLIAWDKQKLVPSCQVIQVASHRLDEQWERRRNRHKTVKMDPETRYLSITVVEEKMDCILLALSCSDGAVRLFSVSEVKNQIKLLWETFHHQRCVLSVATCSLEDNKGNMYKLLFSAATDGKIAAWLLTEALPSLIDNSFCATTSPIPCLDIPAHQSGINSLAVWVEKLGPQEGCCLVTVASGGDDGQLTVSTIRVQYPEDVKSGGSIMSHQCCNSQTLPQPHVKCLHQLKLDLHSQSHVPLAHAASLTALKLLSPGLLVSTSSDQRVCLWKVSGTSISHCGALCSHVADAAGLAVWEEEEGKVKNKTGSEQVNVVCEEKVSGAPLGTKIKMTDDGGFSRDKRTADECKDRGAVDAVSKNSDSVCRTNDKQRCETSDKPRKQTGNYCGEGDTEVGLKASSESREKRAKVGWVLVCGQGFQLLRIRNTEMDE